MMKKIISILLLLTSCSSLNKIAHPPLKKECINLLSVRIMVDIPRPINFNIRKYEEGIIYTFIFSDGGCVFFHEGALMQFEMDTYKPAKIIHAKKYTMYSGKEHNKLWKKYVSGDVRIYYYNVDSKYKKRYDNIFATLRILRK